MSHATPMISLHVYYRLRFKAIVIENELTNID